MDIAGWGRVVGRYWFVVAAFLAVIIPAQAQVIIFVPTGPSAPPMPRAEPGKYDNIRTVAVLSGLGQRLTIERRHPLLTKVDRIDIGSWGFDDAIVAFVKRYVGERFQVKEIAYDRREIAQIPDGLWDHRNPNLRSKFQPEKARRILGALPKEGVDAFIIIRPASELSDGERGLFLVSGDEGDVRENFQPQVWTNFKIDIVNPRTLTRIANSYSRVQPHKGGDITWTGVYTGRDLLIERNMSLDEDQVARLRDEFSRLLASSLVETLRSLELGLQLPEVGERTVKRRSTEEGPFPNIKSVGLVSAIGDELELRHEGLAEVTPNDVAIDEWQVDARVQQIARELLEKRFEVKDVPFDRSTLANTQLLDDDGKWVSKVPALAPSQDVDAYVVILKHPLRTGAGNRPAGLGVWNQTILFKPQTAVFANYAIALIDARSLNLMVGLTGAMDTSFPIRRPFQIVDNDVWPEKATPAAAELPGKIRETVTSLLENSVRETLLRMQLTDSVIADGLPLN